MTLLLTVMGGTERVWKTGLCCERKDLTFPTLPLGVREQANIVVDMAKIYTKQRKCFYFL